MTTCQCVASWFVICVATHCIFSLQGRHHESLIENVLDDLFSSAFQSVPDSLEKSTIIKLWNGDLNIAECQFSSCHVIYTLVHVKKAVLKYNDSLVKIVLEKNQSISIPDKTLSNKKYSTCSDSAALLVESESKVSVSRMLSEGAVPISNNSSVVAGTPDISLRKESQIETPLHNRSNNSLCNNTSPATVFRRAVEEVSLEGGWGTCVHACVVGGVLGALGGFINVPQSWLNELGTNNLNYLNNKVNLLLDMFGLP